MPDLLPQAGRAGPVELKAIVRALIASALNFFPLTISFVAHRLAGPVPVRRGRDKTERLVRVSLWLSLAARFTVRHAEPIVRGRVSGMLFNDRLVSLNGLLVLPFSA